MEIKGLDEFHSYTPVKIDKVLKKEDIPKKISDSVKLIRKDGDESLVLMVLSDIASDTEFYDFRNKLKSQGFVFTNKYCDRKTIEHLNNIFAAHVDNESGEELDSDDENVQAKVVEIIRRAVENRASDIHFQVGQQSTYIKFRIDGKLRPDSDCSAEAGRRLLNTLYNSMSEERSASSLSYNEPTDAKIREEFVQHLGLSTGRFAGRPAGGNKIVGVIRLIKRRRARMQLGELGLTPQEIPIILRVLSKPSGVIFSSGPTGHGKSTLSQCMAELVTSSDEGLNVITIEDPIESPIQGAFQTPLIIGDRGNRELLDNAWGSAIKNVMRLDPDWIYIGEVRDKTSARGATEAAETGHNVITTIHTKYPIDILSRLKNFDVDYDHITDATLITCLIGLRLVPLLCPKCRKSYLDNKSNVGEVFQQVIEKHADIESVYLRDKNGCEDCDYTGRKGRTGVFEVIETNAEFMRLYQTEGKISAYADWYKKGGVTLCENVLRLVNDGVIDPVDSHKDICNLDRDSLMFTQEVINDAKTFRSKMNGRGYE